MSASRTACRHPWLRGHDGSRCLTLELSHERYRRVVIEVDRDQDHAALASEIQARIGGRQS